MIGLAFAEQDIAICPKGGTAMGSKFLLRVDAEMCMALASSTALAKAISDQMTLVKTHGDLTGIAKMCSVMCGGGLDFDSRPGAGTPVGGWVPAAGGHQWPVL